MMMMTMQVISIILGYEDVLWVHDYSFCHKGQSEYGAMQ